MKKKHVLMLMALAIALLLTSCSSGWSCKKRYVTNEKQIINKQNC